MNGSGRDTASRILLGIALAGAILTLFYDPFLIAPIAFIATLVGSAISVKNTRFGLMTTMFVTLCFLVGASIAIWESNPLY
jgi:uncharacterized membrane protein YjjP (DUF1212 family)